MIRVSIAALLACTVGLGCGEDKDYGDPIEDPNARASALGAIANAQLLPSMTTNDSALFAVNALSANFNLLTGAKYQHQNGVSQRVDASGGQVDEACIVVTSTTITYDNCDFIGATVDGTVSVDASNVSVDVRFESSGGDLFQTTDVTANVDVTDQSISGFVDFDLEISTDNAVITSIFDGDFDIDLAGGCAVGGDLEVHAAVAGNGQSISVWAKADYGPTCEDIVIR